MLVLVMTVFSVTAQVQVKGTVKSKTGELLPGVNVTIKGSTSGTVTDPNGNYTLNAQNSDILVALDVPDLPAGRVRGPDTG